MLLLAALMAGSGSAWAEETTIASFSASTYNGGTTNNWSVSNSSYQTSGGGYYQLISNTASITTPSINWSEYKDVNITITGRKYGGPNATQGKISVSQGSTELTSYSPSGTSLAASSALSISPSGTGSLTIACLGASSSKGCGVSAIVIKGTVISNDPSSDVKFANATVTIDLKDGNTCTQTATTATGYSGGVTYSMTANTAGATINETTGEVMATKAGSVTIQATASAVTGSWASSTATYTLTVNDTRVATTTTIITTGITNIDVNSSTVAGSLTANVTETTSGNAVAGATVTWESSEPSVATINENGVVTLVAKGKTTITATYAGTSAYIASSGTYELTVTNSSIISIDLSNTLFGLSSTGENGNEQSKTVDNVTITTGCKSSASSKTYYASDHIRFYKDSYLTLDAPSGYVITGITLNRYSNGNWNPDKVTASTGSLSIVTDALEWTGITSSITFDYTGQCRTSSVDVTLVNKVPATVTSAGWATLVAPCAVSFTDEEAYIINSASTSGTTLTEVSSVPAGTPVLLKGAGEHTLSVVASSSTDVSDNCLKVSDGTAKDDIYVLADGKYGVGFYRWVGESALSEGKVYMQIPSSSREFFSLGGESQGIEAVRSSQSAADSCFNLNGQRVDIPQKGLYIVNGKKVIIK